MQEWLNVGLMTSSSNYDCDAIVSHFARRLLPTDPYPDSADILLSEDDGVKSVLEESRNLAFWSIEPVDRRTCIYN